MSSEKIETADWIIFSCAIGGVCLGLLSLFEVPRTLLWGWILFLFRTIPRIEFDFPSIVLGVVGTVLFAFGIHLFAKRLIRSQQEKQNDQPELTQWKFRTTFCFVAMLYLLFVAGISAVGVTHQIIWISNSSQPRYQEKLKTHWVSDPQGTLRQLGIALSNYQDTHEAFPCGGTFDETGKGLSGWALKLGGFYYFAIPEVYNDKIPWSAPENQKYFRGACPVFLNNDLPDAPFVDSEGFGLSHYAANSRVMGPNQSIESIRDGASNTLLVGEVNSLFLPWNHPFNFRDPALGINKVSHGFGGPPNRKGVYFALADSSVRFISESIDPAVLQALSTPNGKEKIKPDFWE